MAWSLLCEDEMCRDEYMQVQMFSEEQRAGASRLCHSLPKISVVIPARNEAANLVYVLPFIPTGVTEVILVDGHSTDETIAEARRLLPSIRVIQQRGLGKGDALRAGCEASTGEIIVLLDADGSTDPGEIPQFIDALMQGNDFAKGSRFLEGSGSTDLTWLRQWGNTCLRVLVNLLFRSRFSDLCYGYNAFWRDCLQEVIIDCTGFEVETQLSLRMQRAKMKIVEVASFEHVRVHGQSNLHAFRDGLRVLRTILREWVASWGTWSQNLLPSPQQLMVRSGSVVPRIREAEGGFYGQSK